MQTKTRHGQHVLRTRPLCRVVVPIRAEHPSKTPPTHTSLGMPPPRPPHNPDQPPPLPPAGLRRTLYLRGRGQTAAPDAHCWRADSTMLEALRVPSACTPTCRLNSGLRGYASLERVLARIPRSSKRPATHARHERYLTPGGWITLILAIPAAQLALLPIPSRGGPQGIRRCPTHL